VAPASDERDPSANLVETYLPKPPADRSGIALTFSGGGFRAVLFELGALRRFNELGLLSRVETITAVSAGAILAAHLAERIRAWPEPGRPVPDFDATVVAPLEAIVRRNLRTGPLMRRWLVPWNWMRATSAIDQLERLFERYLTRRRLAELAEDAGPRYVFVAVDKAFATSWESSSARVGSRMAGFSETADWSVAHAVATTSAYPPAFSSLPAGFAPDALTQGTFPDGDERDTLITKQTLSDGGAFDEFAVEPVWRDHELLIVLDGGSTYGPSTDVGLQRDIEIMRKQVVLARKRWLISNMAQGVLDGAYLGLASHVEHFETSGPGYSARLVDERLATIRTDFDAFDDDEIATLQNHGYLLAEAAYEAHLQEFIDGPPAPLRIPYPPAMDEGRAWRSLEGSGERTALGRGRWLPGLF